jgi:hypothetical protein
MHYHRNTRGFHPLLFLRVIGGNSDVKEPTYDESPQRVAFTKWFEVDCEFEDVLTKQVRFERLEKLMLRGVMSR